MSARLGRVSAVSWRIFDRRDGKRVLLRGRMDEFTCRDYVLRAPDRYQLVRVDITEESEEIDPHAVTFELDPDMRIQTPAGCVPVSAMEPDTQRALANLVAAAGRHWAAIPPEKREELERRQADSIARIRRNAGLSPAGPDASPHPPD